MRVANLATNWTGTKVRSGDRGARDLRMSVPWVCCAASAAIVYFGGNRRTKNAGGCDGMVVNELASTRVG